MTRRALVTIALLAFPLLLVIAAIIGVLVLQQGGLEPFRVPRGGDTTLATDTDTLARGAYLARIGNCAGCHTTRGGDAYAGGRAFPTPYGTIHSSNITSDPVHGIGDWSPAEFRHVMRHGVSRNGVLSPVFPYASFAHLRDDELDALFAHLRGVKPSPTTPPPHALDAPASLPGAMLAWRLFNYRPAPLATPADATPAWQRGQQLVTGIGHCAMCHGERGTLSSLHDGLAGNRLVHWYAPALDRDALARYAPGELARYLRDGVSSDHAAYGPMADVIAASLQHLSIADADAIATYLQSLPPPMRDHDAGTVRSMGDTKRGHTLYAEHCADCHGEDGRGEADRYPSLVQAASLTAPDPVNAVRIVLYGAMPPTTPNNPQPHTMPPFAQQLPPEDIAAIVNAMRERFGERGRPVTVDDVRRLGGIALP